MADKKVALVTGGTSGIGLACARALQRAGWQVYTLSRREGGDAAFRHMACDVTDEAACRRAAADVVKETRRLDLLVHCAGSGISGAAEFTEYAEAERQIAINLLGAANMARAVIGPMRNQCGGRIIFISSVAAVTPIPFQAWYSASKAALNSYAMALHNEVSRFGISVCAVMPGDTATGFTAARHKAVTGDDMYQGAISRSVSRMERDEMSGASPDKCASLVVRLAGKRKTAPTYTVGAGYAALTFLAKLLPGSLCRWILKKLYA